MKLESPPLISSWVETLMDWFRKNKRDLPWRRKSDPYSIWVSEVMLQQTQVKTVLLYFERFLELFPTALALAKAEVLRLRIKEPALLITADQVVLCNGEILEKPESPEQARRFLKGYAKYPAQPVNAVVVTNTETGAQAGENDENTVYFRAFPDDVIEQLIAEGNIFRQAGSFSLEDPLVAPYVERIVGTLDSVEGLPKEITERLMKVVQS